MIFKWIHFRDVKLSSWCLASHTNRLYLQVCVTVNNKKKTPLGIAGPLSLHWCHNGHDGVSNHQPHGCLLNRIFRRRSKKTSKLRVTGLYVWTSPGPVNSSHKGPVTRKMFPFNDVIMVVPKASVILEPFLCHDNTKLYRFTCHSLMAYMITPSKGNTIRGTGPLWGESPVTGE